MNKELEETLAEDIIKLEKALELACFNLSQVYGIDAEKIKTRYLKESEEQ